MIKKTIFTIATSITLICIWAPTSYAADTYSNGVKNWEKTKSSFLDIDGDDSSDICDKMFAGDEKNLFKDVICSLMRVTAASTSQFATEMTCEIQSIPTDGNYVEKVDFNYKSNICRATLESPSTTGSGSEIFGSKMSAGSLAGSTNGIYAPSAKTTLTDSLIENDGGTKKAYDAVKWILSAGVLIALLIFAFANILNIEVNTYAIKKALPRIIVALIGGWVSLTAIILISRFIDFCYRLSIFSPYQALHPMTNIFNGNFSFVNSTTAVAPSTTSDLENSIALIFAIGGKLLGDASGSSLSALILGSFILGLPALVVIAFEYVMALRPFAVSLLTAVAPLAFVSLILPQTQGIFRRWSQYLAIALFYPLIVNFVFYFINTIELSSNNQVAFFAQWSFKIFIIAALIRLPFAVSSDLNAIVKKIAESDLGASLKLNKLFLTAASSTNAPKQKSAISLDRKSDVIAPIRKFFVDEKREKSTKQRSLNAAPRSDNPEELSRKITKLMSVANKINGERSAPVMQRSIADLPSNTLKTVIDRDDAQIWRDTRLIEQLKSQNGQILDEQGAAVRADSVRKIVRLAQDNKDGELQNKDLIKFLAIKGMLSSLPQETVQKSFEQKIIDQNDINNSFPQGFSSNSVMRNITQNPNAPINTLIAQDHRDYLTGFHQLENQISEIAKVRRGADEKTVNAIVQNLVKNNGSSLDKNSDYFVDRLQSNKNTASTNVASALMQAGVEGKTAVALAQNRQVDFAQITKYLPEKEQNGVVSDLISEQVAKRDLNDKVASKISEIAKAEKTNSVRAITGKISQALKANPEMKLDEIATLSDSFANKIKDGATPQEISSIVSNVEKFHPSVRIKTTNDYSSEDIEAVEEKALEVATIAKEIKQTGMSESDVAQNPDGVIHEVIKKMLSTTSDTKNAPLANDNGTFSQELSKISPEKK